MKKDPAKSSFIKIAESYGIALETAEQLFDAWNQENGKNSHFNLINVLYYFGGLLIILAMTWFITAHWESLDGYGIALVGSLYMLLFASLGYRLWKQHNLHVPGGLLITFAVSTTPFVVYGIERALGFWSDGTIPVIYYDDRVWVRGNWFFMELATLLVGVIALYFVRFPFIIAPIAFTLWYMSMDLTSLLFGQNEFTYSQRSAVSILFGLHMFFLAFFYDRKVKEDYAFWIYLFGLIAFWGGLASHIFGKGEVWQLLWGCTNLGLIIISVLLQRKTFIVFGILGFLGYLGHLAYEFSRDSRAFPLVLSLIGLVVIWLGVLYQQNKAKVENTLIGLLPDSIKRNLPIYRENNVQ
jgi:hypothetical protein